jgi:CDGSH-type Zn-finger protein
MYRVRKLPAPEARGSFSDWETYEKIETEDEYWLCRCGHSTNKPFCTGMHEKIGFDGTETAPTDDYSARRKHLGGGDKLAVYDDRSICAHAAFCSNATTNIWKASKLIDDDDDLREVAKTMAGKCPSGALTIEVDGVATEPEMEPQIWVQEDASILLRGGITIRRADGQPIETRRRMALCRCGQSGSKPLCDGSHAEAGFTDA